MYVIENKKSAAFIGGSFGPPKLDTKPMQINRPWDVNKFNDVKN